MIVIGLNVMVAYGVVPFRKKPKSNEITGNEDIKRENILTTVLTNYT